MRNHWYTQGRKSGRAPQMPAGLAESVLGPDNQEDIVALKELQSVMQTCLSDDKREALLVVGALGYDYQEAAEILSLPVGTVKSRVHRAREALKELDL